MALLTPEAGDAAVWRAAGRRLQVELNELPAGSLGAAMSADVAGWRTAAPAARAEAATALELARRWFAAIQASFTTARWPGDRPARAYAQIAPLELLSAWRELEQAAAAGETPQLALARAARVRDWTLGLVDRPSPFDTLESDAIEAMTGAVGPALNPEAPPTPLSSTPVAGLLFAGPAGDRIGPRGAQPDGLPDVSLDLFAIHRGRTPVRIDLVPVDAANRPCCGRRWSSGDPSAEFLGVISGNIGNGAGYGSSLAGFGDQITLVANDGPAFQRGARLAAIIFYADGSRDHALHEIPARARP